MSFKKMIGAALFAGAALTTGSDAEANAGKLKTLTNRISDDTNACMSNETRIATASG